jgi:phosphatidylglycerophosphatase A
MGWTGKLFVSFLGLGYLPRMPGTWGSFGAALLYLALTLTGLPMFAVCLVVSAIFAVLTIALGGRAEEAYGKKDPQQVVTDEVAGFFLSAAFLIPVKPLAGAACAFFLFRFFDIVKPPPARQLESLPRGWGLTLDDLAAGVYSCVAGHLVFLFVLPRYLAG